jgi:hypothetical protein
MAWKGKVEEYGYGNWELGIAFWGYGCWKGIVVKIEIT